MSLISASAIGYYGERGDELLTEGSAVGQGFLAELAQEWEAEALKATALGVRVVLARFGIVLAKHGGALPQMMAPFKFGLGAKLGSGRQWTSWISLDDVISIIRTSLMDDRIAGPVNVVSPAPVTNTEFTRVLAQVMHRPALFAVPALRVAAGLGRGGRRSIARQPARRAKSFAGTPLRIFASGFARRPDCHSSLTATSSRSGIRKPALPCYHSKIQCPKIFLKRPPQ